MYKPLNSKSKITLEISEINSAKYLECERFLPMEGSPES